MKWMKFRIKTVVEAEDVIISELYDRGLEGAQIEDKVPLTALDKEQMFVDILPETGEDDGIAYLSFFAEEKEDGSLDLGGTPSDKEQVLLKIEEALSEVRAFMEIGEGAVEVSETEDIDWINNWKQYFHQFYIDDLLVIPSWEEVKPEDQDKKILHIDPGTAFGTGMHETTRLCIGQIKKYVTPDTELLDVGTGSGILHYRAHVRGETCRRHGSGCVRGGGRSAEQGGQRNSGGRFRAADRQCHHGEGSAGYGRPRALRYCGGEYSGGGLNPSDAGRVKTLKAGRNLYHLGNH